MKNKPMHELSGYIHNVMRLLNEIDKSNGFIDEDIKEVVSLLKDKEQDINNCLNEIKNEKRH